MTAGMQIVAVAAAANPSVPLVYDVVWTSLLLVPVVLAVLAIIALVVGLRRRAEHHAALEERVAALEARLAQSPKMSSSEPAMKKGM